jgi:hypothetical protein
VDQEAVKVAVLLARRPDQLGEWLADARVLVGVLALRAAVILSAQF